MAVSHKIVLGDFNLTLNPEMDRHNTIERHPSAVKKLKSIMREWGLLDLWRVRNPHAKRFTWDRNKPKYVASRIDNILVSEGVSTLVENITHINGIRTDHSAVFCTVRMDQNDRGPGYWKLNCQLLTNKNFVDRAKCLFKTLNTEYASPG